MNESQYIEEFLDRTADPGTRWTPQTFLAYTLHGKAKDYSAGYHDALMRALSRRLAAGTVTEIRSKGGSTTYIRTEDAARANRAHVRALLAEQQPGYAAALEIMVRTVVV